MGGGCFWGHDWETVKFLSADEARQAAATGREPRYGSGSRAGGGIQKVCLRCGAVVDTITPLIARVREDFEHSEARRIRARDIFRNGGKAKG